MGYDKIVSNGKQIVSWKTQTGASCYREQIAPCVHAYALYAEAVESYNRARTDLVRDIKKTFLSWSLDRLWHLSIAGAASTVRCFVLDYRRISSIWHQIPALRADYEAKRRILEEKSISGWEELGS